MNNMSNNRINYSMISLFQLIFSILVIMLHAQRLFSLDSLHFIQKSMFSRMAVPFFMICSSYFLRAQVDSKNRFYKVYLLNMVRSYTFWSTIYLPYALIIFFSLKLPIFELPLAILVAYFYTGFCYHLWYIPAFILGTCLIIYLNKYIKVKWLLLFSLLLYLLGTIETYSAYLSGTKFLQYFNLYKQIFFTSRNGIFYSPIFICFGIILYDYRENKIFSYIPLTKLLISILIWSIEGYYIFINQGYDKNFFIGLLPVSLFLFNWILRTNLNINKNWYILKKLSVYFFYLHPIFIEIGFFWFNHYHLKVWQTGIFVFLFAICGTFILSMIILKFYPKRTNYINNLKNYK